MTSQKELIPMRPGDVLRLAREKRKISLEQAARESRIRPSVIEAIESGESSHIPSVYLRGYIRNYARYLDVDASGFEEQVRKVRGSEPAVRSVFTYNTNRNSSEKWLKISSYLAASALIATLAWQFTHEAVRWSQGETPLNQASQDEAGSTAAPDSGSPKRHLSASIASIEVMKERGQLGSAAAAEEAWAAVSESRERALPEGHHRLQVTTSADTWVEILGADGVKIEMDLIRAGTRREYTGPGPYHVMVGRASAVLLTLDGESVDLGPHTRGNVARVTLAAAPADPERADPGNH
jgi:cytoskeleton protein RodZ